MLELKVRGYETQSLQLFAKTLATALVGEKKIARPRKIGL